MNWVSALAPWEWMVLGLVPPGIVMLYFLKLKRMPMAVPTTFLWRKTIEDLHVNSLWQKLKQSLLLYLQLLFLAAIILACLRPGISGSQVEGRRLIFLVDHSASMQATDVSPSRLEVAKDEVLKRMEGMKSNDVAMLIAFSDRADVKKGFTSDKQELMAALRSIQPTNRTTDLGEALRAAAGLANPGRSSFEDINDVQVADALPADLLIFSDGAFPSISEFNLGNLKPEYNAIGNFNTTNVGILAFSVQRNEEKPEEVEAFGRIVNEGPDAVQIIASLYSGERLLDASSVDLPPNESRGVSFQLKDWSEGDLRLELDSQDTFAVDNVAHAALRPLRQIQLLLVTSGNDPLVTALSTAAVKKLAEVTVQDPAYLEDAEYLKKAESGEFDLIVFDQTAPKQMPSSNTLFIGAKPPIEQWKLGETQVNPIITTYERAHPIMQYLELNSVRIMEGNSVDGGEGSTALITSDIGPLASVTPRGPFQDMVLGFALVKNDGISSEVNTDWPIKRSFPLFVYSVVEYLGGGVTTASAPNTLPGQPITMTLSNRYGQYTIKDPKGKDIALSRGGQSQTIFTQTDTLGLYQVFPGDSKQAVESFTVNLFSSMESNIVARSQIETNGQELKGLVGKIEIRAEYWRWILAIAFVVLLLEWVIYNRRVLV